MDAQDKDEFTIAIQAFLTVLGGLWVVAVVVFLIWRAARGLF